jgi:hypothetical protein
MLLFLLVLVHLVVQVVPMAGPVALVAMAGILGSMARLLLHQPLVLNMELALPALVLLLVVQLLTVLVRQEGPVATVARE